MAEENLQDPKCACLHSLSQPDSLDERNMEELEKYVRYVSEFTYF